MPVLLLLAALASAAYRPHVWDATCWIEPAASSGGVKTSSSTTHFDVAGKTAEDLRAAVARGLVDLVGERDPATFALTKYSIGFTRGCKDGAFWSAVELDYTIYYPRWDERGDIALIDQWRWALELTRAHEESHAALAARHASDLAARLAPLAGGACADGEARATAVYQELQVKYAAKQKAFDEACRKRPECVPQL